MKAEDQKQFITNFMDSVRDSILTNIDKGKVPEEWDGMELRELVKDTMIFETYYFNDKKRSARYKDYQNTVIVNNL